MRSKTDISPPIGLLEPHREDERNALLITLVVFGKMIAVQRTLLLMLLSSFICVTEYFGLSCVEGPGTPCSRQSGKNFPRGHISDGT